MPWSLVPRAVFCILKILFFSSSWNKNIKNHSVISQNFPKSSQFVNSRIFINADFYEICSMPCARGVFTCRKHVNPHGPNQQCSTKFSVDLPWGGSGPFLDENTVSWYVYRNFPSSCNSHLSKQILYEIFVFQLCNGLYYCKFTEILEYRVICLQFWVSLLFNQTQQNYKSSFTFVLLGKTLSSHLNFLPPDVIFNFGQRNILSFLLCGFLCVY